MSLSTLAKTIHGKYDQGQGEMLTLSLVEHEGKWYAPVQSEVENIALFGPLQTHHRIFYEPIPLASGSIVWDEEACSWRLL